MRVGWVPDQGERGRERERGGERGRERERGGERGREMVLLCKTK